ncbi:hypothetical protein [Methylobacterium gnaphalii]|uniref:Uncharacterized protein n=1 Tax=Methylobacterium gnaphalii TaxID=1010610 RepID=A0A512JG25_9HYPH|nr:hypothetical protein [Methylobacterium gnaphalii]GEP08907.1 hypothetical protein MGN01_07520 [Methylobacterium gnaphalii]GJD70673.1 hypothetical protein MMMDOFMJ_3625 [Methylobacterium gnaphalii]GLS50447.1 hypothetical protein GCM10007885_32990 [Methylobacterium gnaphalii]
MIIEDGKPAYVCEAGAPSIAADDFDRCEVRLIERVLPAGRATAAVEKLREAANTRCGDDMWSLICETIALIK